MACMTASMTRVGGMTVRLGMVCGTSLGAFEVLWVTEGPLVTLKGEYLLVKKQKKKK